MHLLMRREVDRASMVLIAYGVPSCLGIKINKGLSRVLHAQQQGVERNGRQRKQQHKPSTSPMRTYSPAAGLPVPRPSPLYSPSLVGTLFLSSPSNHISLSVLTYRMIAMFAFLSFQWIIALLALSAVLAVPVSWADTRRHHTPSYALDTSLTVSMKRL